MAGARNSRTRLLVICLNFSLLAGCADSSSSDPIQPGDQVRDLQSAVKRAMAVCGFVNPDLAGKLVKDQWIIFEDNYFGTYSAKVNKKDGKVSGCGDIEH